MALADDIRAIRERSLAELNSAHDYHVDTKVAWLIALNTLKAGPKFEIRNLSTGTVTTNVEFANKAPRYVAEQLAEATFQQFIAIFEGFFFDLLRLWLTAHPQSLAKKQVDFRSILELPDRDAIIDLVVRRELNEVLYDRPAGWFAFLVDRVKLGCPTPEEVERVAEAKASRDVLIHNRGVANPIYESKAGRLARVPAGVRIEIPEDDHRGTWELLRKVVADLADAAVAKAA